MQQSIFVREFLVMPARKTRRRTSGEEAVVKTCCEKSRHFFVCLGYLRALESKNVQILDCVVVFMLGLKKNTKTLTGKKNEQLGLDLLCRQVSASFFIIRSRTTCGHFKGIVFPNYVVCCRNPTTLSPDFFFRWRGVLSHLYIPV